MRKPVQQPLHAAAVEFDHRATDSSMTSGADPDQTDQQTQRRVRRSPKHAESRREKTHDPFAASHCWWLSPRLPAMSGQARADLVIRAEQAAIRTEGGPHAGGGWNLWSNGRVGQPLRFATPGTYTVVVRAWGSPAAGVWPEMALLIDGR
jgi:hypothetical protein